MTMHWPNTLRIEVFRSETETMPIQNLHGCVDFQNENTPLSEHRMGCFDLESDDIR
jgi:hypothetical protein